MPDIYHGVKKIQIHAQARYPIVSAYEFHFLKTEAEIQTLLKPCTIYFILQRPLLWFQGVRVADREIILEITDGLSNPPLKCIFEPGANGGAALGEEILIDILFYKKNRDPEPPFNDVAALKILNTDKKFLDWFSPQKFLYEYLSGSLKANIEGNISHYLDYSVLYIGKSFSQMIWERLTGHEKMQEILTLEESISANPNSRVPFEIALLMLDIEGYSETHIFPIPGLPLDSGIKPIVHEIRNDDGGESYSKYYDQKLDARAPELTSEVEGMLINAFKPKHNEKLFENYPLLKKGTRSAGYTESFLKIEKMPAILKTRHYTLDLLLPHDTKPCLAPDLPSSSR
jgi:hypothetical protein